MTRSFVVFAVLLVLLTLNACEGGTTYSKTIENHSSETLTVQIYSAYGGFDSPVNIKPNESKVIWIDDQMGSFVSDTYNCTDEFDSIKVTISNNKRLKNDMMNPDNWHRESSDGRNAKERCTFEVVDQDLE